MATETPRCGAGRYRDGRRPEGDTRDGALLPRGAHTGGNNGLFPGPLGSPAVGVG